MSASLFIGRFQPLHDGHVALIRTVLDEGRPVVVALRDTPLSASDPYTVAERRAMVESAFPAEVADGRVRVIAIPDIAEVVYGRNVGWGIREIRLDAKTEAISATAIRRQEGDADGGR